MISVTFNGFHSQKIQTSALTRFSADHILHNVPRDICSNWALPGGSYWCPKSPVACATLGARGLQRLVPRLMVKSQNCEKVWTNSFRIAEWPKHLHWHCSVVKQILGVALALRSFQNNSLGVAQLSTKLFWLCVAVNKMFWRPSVFTTLPWYFLAVKRISSTLLTYQNYLGITRVSEIFALLCIALLCVGLQCFALLCSA